MSATDARAKLGATLNAARGAQARAKRQAFVAGSKLARVSNAGSTLRDQMQAALLARDAYWARIGAEGEKFRATYLLLAANERKTALDAAMAAENAKDAREQRYLVERTTSFEKRASILETAAEQAAKAVEHVPEPEVVSTRRAQRLANAMGADFSKPNQQPGVAARLSPLMNSKLYNPLVNWMYTDDIRAAAGGFAGVGEMGVTPGDGTTGDSFIDSVKRAIGMGLSEAGKAATKAGQDAAKDNPGTAVAAQGAGGLLAAIAASLGVSFDAGYKNGGSVSADGERKFPWGAAAAAAAVVGAAVLVWRAR